MVAEAGQQLEAPGAATSTLVKAKTRRGKRYLEKRAPKLVEDAKRVLLLYGKSTSAVLKDVMSDIHKLKKLESVKFSRKNENVQPFEAGGEASLEFYCNKSNCSLFLLGSHTKKRPHNLVLGRLYDFHLLDALELGVTSAKSITDFAGAGASQLGNKPAMVFVGEKFESVPDLVLAKSLLMDLFRGQEVKNVNLAGLDRVLLFVAAEDGRILMRQYTILLKKSGTKVPRTVLQEMGPSLDLTVRRTRTPPPDLAKEALQKPRLGKKKEKNVSSDSLAGKVGRIYMPRQEVDTLGLHKPKGLKRERRAAAAAKQDAKRARTAGPAPADGAGGDDSE